MTLEGEKAAPSAANGSWRGLGAVIGLARIAVRDWIEDRATSRGAAIAYYTTFSLAPLLLLVISIAGLVWGQEAAQGAVVAELRSLTGAAGARAVEAMIESAADRDAGLVGTAVSIGLLVFGATTVFAELQDALNQLWNAPPAKSSGFWSWLRTRLLSFSLIVAFGFLLLVSLTVSTLITALSGQVGDGAVEFGMLVESAHFALSLAITAAMFAAIYKILPDVRISWRDVAIGAGITAVLFHIGKYLISIYLALSNVASSYGAAGALVIVLVWVYYSTQVFLLGAEFTRAYAFAYGSRRTDGIARRRDPARPRSHGTGPAPAR